MNHIVEKRKTADRRTQVENLPYDRRKQPDRRLNNLAAEWIPVSEITLYPVLRQALRIVSKKP